jgi:hypothetical protein
MSNEIKQRHVALLRSICEMLGPKGKSYCCCGELTSDPIHYKKEELEGKELTEWRGLTIIKE